MKEHGEQILWLRKLVPGGTDKSYGIQVARMAGVPPEVVDRARQILKNLEKSSSNRDILGASPDAMPTKKQKLQLTLFEAEKHPVIEALEALDLSVLTPVEALMKLDELKRSL